jgi:hypothetical protein
MASGGKILVRLPVADSRNTEEYGPDWFALDPPRHLFVPTRHGLHLIAERAGLVVALESDDSGGYSEARSQLWARGISTCGDDGKERAFDEYSSTRELEEFDERARLSNQAGQGDTSRFLLQLARDDG